jgi:hypothetical protein
MFTGGREVQNGRLISTDGLRGFRGPAVKSGGGRVANYESFGQSIRGVRKSSKLMGYPNRTGNYHLRIHSHLWYW